MKQHRHCTNKSAYILRLPRGMWKKLKIYSGYRDRSMALTVIEALDLFFKKDAK